MGKHLCKRPGKTKFVVKDLSGNKQDDAHMNPERGTNRVIFNFASLNSGRVQEDTTIVREPKLQIANLSSWASSERPSKCVGSVSEATSSPLTSISIVHCNLRKLGLA